MAAVTSPLPGMTPSPSLERAPIVEPRTEETTEQHSRARQVAKIAFVAIACVGFFFYPPAGVLFGIGFTARVFSRQQVPDMLNNIRSFFKNLKPIGYAPTTYICWVARPFTAHVALLAGGAFAADWLASR
jgi:hypothetical protein